MNRCPKWVTNTSHVIRSKQYILWKFCNVDEEAPNANDGTTEEIEVNNVTDANLANETGLCW